MYGCINVYMHLGCMNVYMYVCMNIYMHACVYVRMYACIVLTSTLAKVIINKGYYYFPKFLVWLPGSVPAPGLPTYFPPPFPNIRRLVEFPVLSS